MKANELMVGDWVQNTFMGNKVLCKVVGISTDITIEYQNRTRKYEALKEVEPIPLTAEILEKNGFVGGEIRVFTTPFLRLRVWCKVEVYKYQPIRGGKQLNAFRLMIGGKEQSGVDININNVHELQHALRLCRIEKEIQL